MATRLRKSVQCGYDEPYSRKSVYAREATSGAGRDPWACKRARKLCDIAGCIRLVCVYTLAFGWNSTRLHLVDGRRHGTPACGEHESPGCSRCRGSAMACWPHEHPSQRPTGALPAWLLISLMALAISAESLMLLWAAGPCLVRQLNPARMLNFHNASRVTKNGWDGVQHAVVPIRAPLSDRRQGCAVRG
jgi:hypothetical protein